MMRALTDDERRGLARVCAVLCTTSLLLMPLASSGSAGIDADQVIVARQAVRDAVLHSLRPEPEPILLRDPFVVPAGEFMPAHDAAEPATAGIPVGMHVTAGTPIASARSRTAFSTRVRAIILGDHPRALVEIGGIPRVVAPGDRIANALVVRVDALGVKLSNGVDLKLEAERVP